MLSVFFMDPFELGLGDSRPEGNRNVFIWGNKGVYLAKEVGGHLQLKSTLLSLCIHDVYIFICSFGLG